MPHLILSIFLSIMTAGQITATLNKHVQKGASPATLWNFGFEIYYQHGFSQKEMAANLAKGYAGARGKTKAQQEILNQAAAYWQKVLAYWQVDVFPDPPIPPDRLPPPNLTRPFFESPTEPMPMFQTPR